MLFNYFVIELGSFPMGKYTSILSGEHSEKFYRPSIATMQGVYVQI